MPQHSRRNSSHKHAHAHGHGHAHAHPPRRNKSSDWTRWLIGLAVGIVFTWFSARSWPLDQLFGGSLHLARDSHDHLALMLQSDANGPTTWSVGLWALAVYFSCLFIIHWLRVLRWKPLLQPYADVSVAELNRVGAVGFMAVFLLPLRLGEFARPYMLARPTTTSHGGVPFGAGLGAIAIERVLDGLLVTGILFAVLIQVPTATLQRYPAIQSGAWTAAIVFGTALTGLFLTVVAREFTLQLTRKIVGSVSAKLAEKIIALVTSFVDGLAVLKSPWYVAQFIGMTIVYWGVNGLGIWVMARGFGLDIPIIAAYAMMSFLVVGMMIPNSPGNVGSFWYFLLIPAGLYGISDSAPRTIAFGLGLWFAQTVQVAAFGVWGWVADGRRQIRLQVAANGHRQ